MRFLPRPWSSTGGFDISHYRLGEDCHLESALSWPQSKICTGNIEMSKGTFLQLEPEKSTEARVLILERSGRSLSALPTSTRLLNPDKGKSLVAAFDQLK